MIPALTAAALLATTPLEQAEIACERDYKACPERDRLRTEERAAPEHPAHKDLGRQLREAQENEQRAERKEAAKAAETKKKCGSDYNRVRVGMAFARIQECAGPFRLQAEDEKGAVYTSPGGWVRVESGKVVKLLRRG
jgi:hypothetical protein